MLDKVKYYLKMNLCIILPAFCQIVRRAILSVTMAAPLTVQGEFDSISLTEIGARFKYDRAATIAWCRRYGLLARDMVCPDYGARCHEEVRNRAVDNITWRCFNNNCRKVVSIIKGSFLKFRISSCGRSSACHTGRPGVCPNSTWRRDLQSHGCRLETIPEGCSRLLLTNHPEQIGGPGVVVEIDKSLFCRLKNHVGHHRENIWVLGGCEQARKRGFLVRVDRRDAATLLPIIEQWVAPGSIMWTDMWADFNQLPNMAAGYQHGTVNHFSAISVKAVAFCCFLLVERCTPELIETDSSLEVESLPPVPVFLSSSIPLLTPICRWFWFYEPA